MAAVFKPLFAAEAANDVLPHPLGVVGTARVPKANFGSTMMISLPARSGAFSANAKEMGDSTIDPLLASVRISFSNTGCTIGVDEVNAVAAIFVVQQASVAATV